MLDQQSSSSAIPIFSAAIGDYPHVRALKSGLIGSPYFQLSFADMPVINRAFAPMVRSQAFDICELAIATYFQALAHGKPLVLLPIILAARFQETAFLCRTDSPILGPKDLRGKRIGIRAYSQTSGMWLRGLLLERYGIAPNQVHWLTLEDAHVAEVSDPPFVERAQPGKALIEMLRSGEVDAIILGNDLPKDAAFRCIFPDIDASARAFEARYGFTPINHMLVIRRDLVRDNPHLSPELLRMFAAARSLSDKSPAHLDPDQIAAALRLAARYTMEQGLLPKGTNLDELCRLPQI